MKLPHWGAAVIKGVVMVPVHGHGSAECLTGRRLLKVGNSIILNKQRSTKSKQVDLSL